MHRGLLGSFEKPNAEGLIRNYIKEFSSLMLGIQNMSDEDKLHNFISRMQA